MNTIPSKGDQVEMLVTLHNEPLNVTLEKGNIYKIKSIAKDDMFSFHLVDFEGIDKTWALNVGEDFKIA